MVFWPIAIIGLAYPFLLLANVLFVIGWLIQKNRYFLFSLVCIVLGWNHFQSFIGLHFPTNCSESVQIASFNGYSFRYPGTNRAMNKEKELEKFLKPLDADIICIQEFVFKGKNQQAYIDYFKKRGYGNHFMKRHYRLAIFSKFPIKNKTQESFGNYSNGYQMVDVQIGKQVFRLFNLHLLSNGISMTAEQVAEKGDLQDKQTWKNIGRMFRNYKNAAQRRVDQAKEIRNYN